MMVTDLPEGHPLRIEYIDPIYDTTPSASRPAPTQSSRKRARSDDDDGSDDARPAKSFRFVVPTSYSRDPNEHNFATHRLRAYAVQAARREERIKRGLPPRRNRPGKSTATPQPVDDLIGQNEFVLELKYERYERAVKKKCGIDLELVRREYVTTPVSPSDRNEYQVYLRKKMMHFMYPDWDHPVWEQYTDEQILKWETSSLYYWTRCGPDGMVRQGCNERQAMRFNKEFDMPPTLEEEEEDVTEPEDN